MSLDLSCFERIEFDFVPRGIQGSFYAHSTLTFLVFGSYGRGLWPRIYFSNTADPSLHASTILSIYLMF